MVDPSDPPKQEHPWLLIATPLLGNYPFTAVITSTAPVACNFEDRKVIHSLFVSTFQKDQQAVNLLTPQMTDT